MYRVLRVFDVTTIIQGGYFEIEAGTSATIITYPVVVNKTLFALNAQNEGTADYAVELFYTWNVGGADNKTKARFLINKKLSYTDSQEWLAICIA